MARHMLARLGLAAQPLPEMRGAVELHLVESHNVYPSAQGRELLDDEWRALTLLLNLSADPADRTAFRELGQSFPFARGWVQVVPLDEGCASLRAALAPFAAQAAWVTAIVFDRPRAGAAFGHVEAIAGALQDLLQHKLPLVMAVGAPADQAAAGSRVRQVCGASVTTRATAISLFVMFACQMAPDTYNCVDFCDLDPLWEDQSGPAVLAEAVWLREAGQLAFASAADREAVRHAATAFTVLLAPNLRSHELRRMVHALRTEMPVPDSLLYFVPMNALVAEQAHAGIALMPILCAGALPQGQS